MNKKRLSTLEHTDQVKITLTSDQIKYIDKRNNDDNNREQITENIKPTSKTSKKHKKTPFLKIT